jgi:ubiquitin-conjugating enzyme E2 O
VQREWKQLRRGLPDSIWCQAFEDRMDLLRAAIVGPADTPYADILFLFDVYLPPNYPDVPPKVYYSSSQLVGPTTNILGLK